MVSTLEKEGIDESSKEPEQACTSCSSFSFKNLGKCAPYLIALIGILILYNIFTLWQTSATIETKMTELEAAAVPLDITLIIITPADCESCYDIHKMIPEITKINVNITMQTELKSDSEEAQVLLEKYTMAKVPAIIVTTIEASAAEKADVIAQLEKLLTKVSDTEFVYENTNPPYLDLAENKVQGLVTIISLISPECKECQDIGSMIPALKKVLTIERVEEITYDSPEAQAYIEMYHLDFAPTFILSSDAGAYSGFAQIWERYGTQEEDDSFVFRNTIPPYVNLTSMEINGLVDIIYVTDNSCVDCYNVTLHKQILQGFGITFDQETTVDISAEEGKTLLEKYDITKVPTIILSSDAAAYSALVQIWSSVGEVAEDGSYIFTEMKQLQGAKYTDLNGEEIAEHAEEDDTA